MQVETWESQIFLNVAEIRKKLQRQKGLGASLGAGKYRVGFAQEDSDDISSRQLRELRSWYHKHMKL